MGVAAGGSRRLMMAANPSHISTRRRTMSAKKTTKKKATKKAPAKGTAKAAKAETNAKPKAPAKKNGKMSLLEASIKVLDAAGKPLHVREIVESVLAKGYWKAGEGKTPH